VGFGLRVQDRSGEETEVGHRPRDVDAAGDAQRLSRVDRLEAGEVVQVLLDEVGDTQEPFRSLGGGRLRPPPEGILRRLDGAVHVAVVTVGDPPAHFAGGRIDIVEIQPALGLDKLTVDGVGDDRHCTARRPPSTGRLTPLR
jgi:hypothetical protein